VTTRAGTVRETGGGVYAVAIDDGPVVEASLRGRLKQEHRTGSRVVIGDRVQVTDASGSWTVESVAARESELARRGRGGRSAKILAANLDRVFVVVALKAPPASTQLVDRLLVLVESSGMHPLLVLNKADLEEAASVAERLTTLYEGLGYRVFVTSAETGRGISELRDEACSGTSAFIGPSGAGKSSLLNVVDPELDLRTGALSRKTGTGRHTTVGSRLIELSCGGLVADTPGFGDVGLWEVEPETVAACYPELAEPAQECRFSACTHLHEPDCGVRAAVEEGRIARSRYESYVMLRGESDTTPSY
jgi:ribosome biogenesis GTPase / thiamine phosphate phosphatase